MHDIMSITITYVYDRVTQYRLHGVQGCYVSVSDSSHSGQRPIHAVLVLQPPWQVEHHLAVGDCVVYPAPGGRVRPVVVGAVDVVVDSVEDAAEVVTGHDHEQDQATNQIDGAARAVELEYPLEGDVDEVEVVELEEEQYLEVVEGEVAAEEAHHDHYEAQNIDPGVVAQVVVVDLLPVQHQDSLVVIAAVETDHNICYQHQKGKEVEEVAPPSIELSLPHHLPEAGHEADLEKVVQDNHHDHDVPQRHRQLLRRQDGKYTAVLQDELLEGSLFRRQRAHVHRVVQQLHSPLEQLVLGLADFLLKVLLPLLHLKAQLSFKPAKEPSEVPRTGGLPGGQKMRLHVGLSHAAGQHALIGQAASVFPSRETPVQHVWR